jgi:hypothetical protein
VSAPTAVEVGSVKVESSALTEPLPLVLHEGIGPPGEKGCSRWPDRLRLKASGPDGVRFFPGRCRATNQCSYCAKLAAVETTEMLWLDACACGSPSLWSVFTTRAPVWDGEHFKNAFEHVLRAVRRRWPGAEYAALVEFTTGYGPRSGGLRRPHLNVFWRGVPVEDAAALWGVAARVWCGQVDALAQFQTCDVVNEDKGGMRGLTRYVALHFQKESQAPPHGWRGHRFRSSRGYFVNGTSTTRAAARSALQRKRALWKAGGLLGFSSPALEMGAEYLLARQDATTYELVVIKPGGSLHPLRLGGGRGADSGDVDAAESVGASASV